MTDPGSERGGSSFVTRPATGENRERHLPLSAPPHFVGSPFSRQMSSTATVARMKTGNFQRLPRPTRPATATATV